MISRASDEVSVYMVWLRSTRSVLAQTQEGEGVLRVAWHQLAWGYYIPTEQESYCNINHLITNTVLLIAAFVIHMTNIFVSLRICYMQSGLTTTIHIHFCDSIWSTRGQQLQTGCVAWYWAAAAGAASARPLCTVHQQQAASQAATGHLVTVAAAKPLLCTGYCPGWSLGNSSRSNNSQPLLCTGYCPGCSLGNSSRSNSSQATAVHWVLSKLVTG